MHKFLYLEPRMTTARQHTSMPSLTVTETRQLPCWHTATQPDRPGKTTTENETARTGTKARKTETRKTGTKTATSAALQVG